VAGGGGGGEVKFSLEKFYYRSKGKNFLFGGVGYFKKDKGGGGGGGGGGDLILASKDLIPVSKG